MRSAARAAFHKTRLGQVFVGLGDRHVVDAELLGEPPHRRQTRARGQLARRNAVNDLLVQLEEERLAIALRQRNPEGARFDYPPWMPLAVRHATPLNTKTLYEFLYYYEQTRAREICAAARTKIDVVSRLRNLADASRLTDI